MSKIGHKTGGEVVPTTFGTSPAALCPGLGIGRRTTDSRSRGSRPRFRAYGRRHIGRIRQLDGLSRRQWTALKVASAVLPFRVNDYVLDELIDWSNIPSDPIFQLTFPQAEMLDHADYLRLQNLLMTGADPRAHPAMCSRDPDADEPASEWPDGAQRADRGRRRAPGVPAQISRDRAVLPTGRADVSRLLHLLFPLASVRRHRAPQVRHA